MGLHPHLFELEAGPSGLAGLRAPGKGLEFSADLRDLAAVQEPLEPTNPAGKGSHAGVVNDREIRFSALWNLSTF